VPQGADEVAQSLCGALLSGFMLFLNGRANPQILARLYAEAHALTHPGGDCRHFPIVPVETFFGCGYHLSFTQGPY
jgi:hypothetical protein